MNNSHSDTIRTAGLWGIQDFREVLVPDGRRFTLTIRVQGRRVQTWIALQGHDPGSEVHFRGVRQLPG